MMRWKIISHSHTQNILCYTKYSIVPKLSNKQSAKVIFRFDRLRTVHSKRQTSHMSIGNLSASPAILWLILSILTVTHLNPFMSFPVFAYFPLHNVLNAHYYCVNYVATGALRSSSEST